MSRGEHPKPRSIIMSAPSSTFSLFVSCFVCLLLFGGSARGQATTPQLEVEALNSIFHGWGHRIEWNNTKNGDVCSGAAVNASLGDLNPGIKCNCSFVNGTTCHITELKAVDLQLEGGIPEHLKDLTKLSKLNLGSNLLSGSIPRALGSLQNLISLDISINKFNGTLPDDLGNLTNLQELYLNSLGVDGEIPSALFRLQKLQILWISDNNFTGSVPDFIGSFRELEDLRLQGNSFQGPIPSSFANLKKLTQLRIGELTNASSTLEFIKNMNSLTTLVLRNSKISGNIPSDLGNYTVLEHLELSFNNLTGQLPQSLFNLPSLTYLFLGNNSLSGTIPPQKGSKLLNIDLSYNELSGSFPSWVNESNLHLNLVANNFVIDNFNGSFLPFGLRCLQKSIPCHHGDPIHSSFAINCGGTQPVTKPNEPEYEIDGDLLKEVSYIVNNKTTWALSSVGRFIDVAIPSYFQKIGSSFINTQYSVLFQSARLSPSSLRYYGLGLENGSYNVKLEFGETLDWVAKKGKRLFDIFVQGNLVAKDFDITKEAGGKVLFSVEKNYTALVTNNFLEIHLFWAGKGTCCIPTNSSYGPSISALSVTPNFKSKLNNPTSQPKKKHKAMLAAITACIIALCFIFVTGIYIWKQKRQLDVTEDEELLGLDVKPDLFSYSELRTATEDFKPTNKLGEGGFGSVFKGVLPDGKVAAVKQLSVSSAQGKRQFITEVATISAVQHRNLVKLYGCCCEGNRRLLVYEYLENRSLDLILFGKKNLHLDWPARVRICLGTARGLAYLHEESSVRIVHRDVKASNILLDGDLDPKISDFGLAKLYEYNKTHISTGVAGTVGYLAPEYAMRGQLTEKADVFGFGIVTLEIVCGRMNTDKDLGADKMYLIEWAWHLHEKRRDLEMMDPTLSSYNEDEALRLIGVAFMCTQASPSRRPTMSQVVGILLQDLEVTEVLTKPSYLMDWKYTEVPTNFSTASTTQNTQISSPFSLLR